MMAHISIITYTGNDKTGVEMCQLKIPVTRARIRRLCPSVYLIIFFVNEITTTYGLIFFDKSKATTFTTSRLPIYQSETKILEVRAIEETSLTGDKYVYLITPCNYSSVH